LTRFESDAFSCSSLNWIEIPRAIRFIDGSAFIKAELSSVSIEVGHDRFMIENDFFIDIVDHRLIRSCSRSSHLEIMNIIEILGSSCFSCCNSLSSISFESNSRLNRIEAAALDRLNHRLGLPSTVLFIASNAVDDPFQISLIDADSCPEFGQWQRLRASGVVVDFRRIRRIGLGLGALAEYEFDLSRFNETSVLKQGPISTKFYQGVDDGFRIVMKSISLLNDIESERFQ
jgi:hypothetical protein